MEKPKKQKKPIYRRWWFWFLAVFVALAIIGSVGGGNETANNPPEAPGISAPPSETPIETEISTATPEPAPSETVQPTPTPTAPSETPEAEISSGGYGGFEAVNDLDAIEKAIAAAIPSVYQTTWFLVDCDEYLDNSVSVLLQVDQGNDDSDAALLLAAECYEIAKAVVDDAGDTFANISVTVVNGGAPIGLFSTEDGKNFISISDGKRTEVTLP